MNKISRLDLTINLLLVVFGTIAVGLVFRECSRVRNLKIEISKGADVSKLFNLDPAKHTKTLAIFLQTEESEVALNIPFYRLLTEAQNENPRPFEIKVFFTTSKDKAKAFIAANDWSLDDFHEVNPKDFGISSVPALVIINEEGRVGAIYNGIISSRKEFEIRRELNLPLPEPPDVEPAKVNVTKRVYDGKAPLKEIQLPEYIDKDHSGAKYQQASFKQIGQFGVDRAKNIYAIYQGNVLKIDEMGNVVQTAKLNAQFGKGFAVDSNGKSYYFLRSRKILVLNNLLQPDQLIDLEDDLAREEICVKMLFSADNTSLFFQTYNTGNTDQRLYHFEVNTHRVEELYRIEGTPFTLPGYGPGIFAWTIGWERLFICDLVNLPRLLPV